MAVKKLPIVISFSFLLLLLLRHCKPKNFHVEGIRIQSWRYLKPPNYILKFPEGSQGNFHANPSCTQRHHEVSFAVQPLPPLHHSASTPQTAATSTMRINKQMCHTPIMLYPSACIKSRYREPRRGRNLQERESFTSQMQRRRNWTLLDLWPLIKQRTDRS